MLEHRCVKLQEPPTVEQLHAGELNDCGASEPVVLPRNGLCLYLSVRQLSQRQMTHCGWGSAESLVRVFYWEAMPSIRLLFPTMSCRLAGWDTFRGLTLQ